MLLGCRAANLDDAERILAGLIQSGTTPTAVELVAGPAWRDITEPNIGAAVLVGLEGTEPEVAWMVETLQREWSELPTHDVRKFAKDEADALWSRLTEFPAAEPSPLVLKISVPPSSVTRVVSLLREIDANVSIGAHAGSGIVIARFAEFDAGDVSTALIGRIQPAALRVGGQAIVLSSDVGELTRQATWGPRQANVDVMESIKRQFDPAGILNPGRFVY
jgi:FAD/FMN-containing dehydrogenase